MKANKETVARERAFTKGNTTLFFSTALYAMTFFEKYIYANDFPIFTAFKRAKFFRTRRRARPPGELPRGIRPFTGAIYQEGTLFGD